MPVSALRSAPTPVRILTVAVAIVGCLGLLGSGVAAEPAAVNSTGPTTAAPGETVTVSITVTNTGAETGGYVGNVSLPGNWTVASQTADGAIWNSGDRAWLWQSIAPDSSTTATITASIPTTASVGSYNVTTAVKSSERIEATTTHTISVESAANSTASEDGEAATASEGDEAAADSESAETSDGLPGFGIGTALAALTAGGLALRRRT